MIIEKQGYATASRNVRIEGNTEILKIRLELTTNRLKEVIVTVQKKKI